jgi:hypothetical protein
MQYLRLGVGIPDRRCETRPNGLDGWPRAFSREQATTGLTLLPRTLSFRERGDEVVVRGSLRVVRPTAGSAESQVTWTYRFRDGLLREAGWGPRHPA